MELTKKRKIMIGVMAVGIAALAVDRFALGPPAEARAAATARPAESPQASSQPTSAPATATDPTGATDIKTALPDYTGLTQRLAELQKSDVGIDPSTSRDLFAEPPDWAPVVHEPVREAGPRPPIEDPNAFMSAYRLESVQLQAVDGARKTTVALINGKEYMEGATLETFVLRGFTDNPTEGRSAVWESRKTGQMFVMRIER